MCGYHAAIEHPDEYDPHWVRAKLTKGLEMKPAGRMGSKRGISIQQQKEDVAFFAPQSTTI